MAQKISIIVLLGLSFFINGFAQTNFIAGEITKKDGSVVVGQIDYQEWKINPKHIDFKDTNTGSAQTYNLKDLLGFHIVSKNETYKRAVVDVNKESIEAKTLSVYQNLKDAAFYAKSNVIRDSVFLLTLVRGALNLYTLTDNDKKVHYYVQKGDDSVKYLIYRIYLVSEESEKGLSIRKTKEYARLLGFLTADCKTTKLPNLDEVNYVEKDLIKYVSAYNTCQNKNDYVKKTDKTISSLYILGGVELPYFSISNSANSNLAGFGSLSPTLGIGGDFGIGRDRNKLSITIESLYKKFDIYTSKSFTAPNNDINTYTYEVGVSYFHFNGGFKYIFSKSNLNPYLRAGFGVSAPLKHSTGLLKINSTDGIHTYNSVEELSLSKAELSVFAGVGIKTKNLFLETRVQVGNSLLGLNGDTNLGITYTSLFLGYSFFNW